MKIKVVTTEERFILEDEAEYMGILKSLGFEFEQTKFYTLHGPHRGASILEVKTPGSVEINTIDDLLALQKKLGHRLLIGPKDHDSFCGNDHPDNELVIQIYDTYME